jgi:hypothetical protein
MAGARRHAARIVRDLSGSLTLFTRCLFCHHPFAPNETLEHFPEGRRIAYDPGRGRLWAICEACGRWSLAPIEERWEALDELERLTTDRARLLSQTEHIALLRAENLDIVRVGRAKLAEEAWWRYGKELIRRRNHTRRLQLIQTGVMVAASAATVALGAGGFFGYYGAGGNLFTRIDRWRRFGRTAWRGAATCPRCGSVLYRLGFRHTRHLALTPAGDDGFALRLGCANCGFQVADAGFQFTGVTADHLLRRVLAYQNFTGASSKTVKAATQAIDEVGSPTELARRFAAQRVQMGELQSRRRRRDRDVRTRAVAFEIAVNDETERRLLELELAQLEERWRQEEEIAAIADGDLTPMPRLNELLLRVGVSAKPAPLAATAGDAGTPPQKKAESDT